MAVLYDLRGKVIEQAPKPRSEDVARMIAHVTKLNEEGRLKALVFTAVHDDNSTANSYSVHDNGVRGELLIGALDSAKDSIKRNMRFTPWVSTDKPK